MTEDILTFKNFSCGYDNNLILKNINFNMKKGEIVGIIGPNGAGKTTLFRAITKIIKKYNGEILLNSFNIKNLNSRDLSKIISIVSQNPEQHDMNVYDFVLIGRTPYFSRLQLMETRKDEELALFYMNLTDIKNLKDKSLKEISGGERQLVYIARSLTQEPKLLLLDEPISNLDITHQVSIMDLIKKLNRELGLSVLIILHDLNIASEYCDRLILLNKEGVIHKYGEPSSVLTYKTIEEVYETVVVVEKNPISKKPFVLLVSENELNNKI